MPIEVVPRNDTRYFLINLDAEGRERRDDPDAPGALLSDLVAAELKAQPYTDVLLMSHGWKGDVPAAKQQYDDWTQAMLDCKADLTHVVTERPSFRPLLIGLHWPSLPWGDEDPDTAAFTTSDVDPVARQVADAAPKVADTEPARAALHTVFTAATEQSLPNELPGPVVDAYRRLYEEAGLNAAGPGGAPGDDIDGFDPTALYQEAMDQPDDFGLPGSNLLLAPLRQLSFWRMKARARTVGDSGGATLLRRLQGAARPGVRFHLMGHSFGCILVSAAVQGRTGVTPMSRPVHSLFLVQGALSLWSYCSAIPAEPSTAGYFHPLIAGRQVAGPIVTTRSVHDTAVRVYYPMGAGVAGQVAFEADDYKANRLPKYGGLGIFGIQGPGVAPEDRDMLPTDGHYGFRPGQVYNLDAKDYINQGGGASGAHNDIAKPAVAHAFWQAIAAPDI